MKKWICLGIGLFAIFVPQIFALGATWQMLGIFAGSIWMWITCSIEIGSIACLSALCLLPGVTPANVFTSSFGNSTIIFLIFSFVLTYALSQTGVLRRVATYFIDNPIAKRNTYCFMGLYFLSMLIIGSFMAPTTVFILYFGIVQEIFTLLNLEKGDPLAKRLMVGTGFFASISCAWTPIAHTFPIMALGYYETATGTAISYIQYMKYSLPIGAILAVFAFFLLCIKVPHKYSFDAIHFEKTAVTKQEWISLGTFLAVVICWVITGIFPKVFVGLNALGTAWPAMIGCLILACVGCLNIKEGFTKGVSWPSIILCAATLAMGSFLTKDEFGIMPAVKSFMEPLLSNYSPILLIATFAVVMTNLISNIVTTTVSFNLFVPVLIATVGLFNPIAATIMIGIGASLAYALPSSIAHIAIAGGSGWATSKDMVLYGIPMMIVSILAICAIGGLFA